MMYDESVKQVLEEITECLKNKNASIMIGAGFSKNAKALSSNIKAFPDWSDLASIFIQKVRSADLKGDRGYDFYDPLKLAYEVEATFGRPCLDNILKDSIPDKEYEPSESHIKLLNLPWSDVFTTNYDTLLERAAEEVPSINYKLVVSKDGLIHSSRSPRIIKLHGCFSAATSLIITEEDYRTYPKKFAPFVNTVQQSLLENTLCLAGFSGDDPNFLKWIGWIRDNLGRDNSPKIYLISVGTIPQSQKNALAQYNITCVDMSTSTKGAVSPEQGINNFIDICTSALNANKDKVTSCGVNTVVEKSSLISKSDDSPFGSLDWEPPKCKSMPQINKGAEKYTFEDKVNELQGIVSEWEAYRKDYPGWIVAPEGIRKKLWSSTRYWNSFLKSGDDLSPIDKLTFQYELRWRNANCLLPIFDEGVDGIIETIRIFEADGYFLSIDDKNTKTSEVKGKVAYLLMELIRYFREEGKRKEEYEFTHLAEKLLYEDKYKNRLSHEKCLQRLFIADLSGLLYELNRWDVNENNTFWAYKKSGLLAEVGELDDANKLLEKTLVACRQRMNSANSISYSDASLESYILMLLGYVKQGMALSNDIFANANRDKYKERLNELKKYQSDPWFELNQLENSIKNTYIEPQEHVTINEFDIGYTSHTRNFIGESTEVLSSFRLLTFFENIGMPFHLPHVTMGKNAAINAIKRIATVAPSWAIVTMTRLGDSKSVKEMFNRKNLQSLPLSLIDDLCKHYMQLLLKVIDTKSDINNNACAYPEVISRLCCKCSRSVRLEVFHVLIKIYESKNKGQLLNVRTLVRRLIKALSKQEIIDNVLVFINLSNIYISSLRDPRTSSTLCDPFDYLDLLSEESELIKHIKPKKPLGNLVSSLVDKIEMGDKSERSSGSRTFSKLQELGILSNQQNKRLQKSLLSNVDEQGLPKQTVFYKFAFINILRDEAWVTEKVKGYILTSKHNIQKEKSSNKSFSMSGTFDSLCNEIIGASRYIEWTDDEARTILNKLFFWWDADKEYLREGVGREEMVNRFSLIPEVVFVLVVKRSFREYIDRVILLAEEYEIYGMDSILLSTITIPLCPEKQGEILTKIERGISSYDKKVVLDGFYAINHLVSHSPELLPKLFDSLDSFIRHNHTTYLVNAFDVIIRLIRNKANTFSERMEEGVYIALEKTIIGFDSLSVEENLHIRKASTKLAYEMYKRPPKEKERTNNILEDWKRLAINDDEFSEVRNQWPQA